MPSVAWAYNQPKGEGTKESPYQISSGDELYWFAAYVNGDPGKENGNYTACAVLTADIYVSEPWTTPIMCYSGTFDGNGHTISGLQKTIRGGGDIGLFGTTEEGSVICNVGIVNCSFSLIGGGGSVGGVCGTNNGTITNCYNTGTVYGTPGLVGGICGTNNGTITNCYNTGSVNNGQESGGVCGLNCENGTITNCYYLIGTAKGGIAGADDTPGSAEVKDATQFASGEVAWLLNGERSEGAEENPLAWYQNIGVDSYPVLDSRHKTVYCGYKDCTLSYSNNQAELRESPVHHYDNGICKACKAYQPATLTTDTYDINGDNTNDNVYEIGNAGQLYWFAGLVNGDASVCNYDANTNASGTKQNKAAYAVLTADIVVNSGIGEGKTMLESLEYDASGNVTNGSSFVAWTPIGFNYENYIGTFDGKGYTVSGLYFNDSSKEKVGLFGYVDSGGKISNVGVLDSYFQFRMFGGGVCGRNDGEISNCYNSSTVVETSGNGHAGGVCGYNYGGKVLNSYNNGIISGSTNTGGVCGYNQSNGEITNCYNSGTVSGKGETNQIAGVCGHNDSNCTISGCYNTGTVSGQNLGGVCEDNHGTVKNCYNTGKVSGQNICGGVCSTNNMYGTVTSCYNRGVVSGTGTQVGGICGTTSSTSSTTNCYYDIDIYSGNAIGVNNNGTVDNVMGKTTKQFKSGEVAYLLNGSSPYGEWGQKIGTDGYPVPGSAYKVLRAAQDGQEGTNYWATFSNRNSNAELMASTGEITVYNATVSGGTLTLTKRSDKKVASGEGVLLKANCEYVNAMNISDEVSAATGENHLVATPATEQTIDAGTGYTLYRLTYNNSTDKTGLGFYLGIVGESKDGSQLKATPGKAYLNVSTEAAKTTANAAPARGFVFPGDDETTGIGEIVIEGDAGISGSANADDRIYNLQGQQVTAPVKGLYIKNNKKVIIK